MQNTKLFLSILTVLGCFLTACGGKPTTDPSTDQPADNQPDTRRAPDSESGKAWARGGTYQAGGVVWNIEAKLKPVGKHQIAFEISSDNSKDHCGNSLKGTATTADTSMDPDLLEASDGMTPVYTYVYEKGQCIVQISIDYPDQKRVWIDEQGCESTGSTCPLTAGDWLKKN